MEGLEKFSLFAIVIACFAAPLFGAACDGNPVQFEDKFADLKNWPDIPKELSPTVSEGHLTLTSNGPSRFFLYHGDVFDDADYCVTFRLLKSANTHPEKNGYAPFAIVYWAKDSANLYDFGISPEHKTFNVDRAVANRWIGTTKWQPSPAIKGVGEQNIIRLSMRAGKAKFYINDQEVAPDSPLADHPPEGGGLIGFGVSSVADLQYVWEVISLKVTK
jgi:hypothetical protein